MTAEASSGPAVGLFFAPSLGGGRGRGERLTGEGEYQGIAGAISTLHSEAWTALDTIGHPTTLRNFTTGHLGKRLWRDMFL